MTVQDITQWLGDYLARLLEIDRTQVDPGLPFDAYGLDSRAAAMLVCDLSDWLQRELDLSIVYDHPSIDELSHHLVHSTED